MALESACFDVGVGPEGGVRLFFSDDVESYGAPLLSDVTVRRSNLDWGGVAILGEGANEMIVSLGIIGAAVGPNFCSLAANAATWIRSTPGGTPVTAPVTLVDFADCPE